VRHDVYLGTDFDDVNDAADPCTPPGRGRWDVNSYNPPAALELGRTYYWRIDGVGDVKTWKGQVWRFTVDQGRARDESPRNFAVSVPPDVNLSWAPGVLATWHDVYLGPDFNDVNDAADPNTLPGRGRTDVNSYNPPGELDLYTTYYWRVDEGSATTFVKGEVWKFTVAEPYVNSIGMEFVYIPPGTFTMGSEDGDFDEKPVHNVTISQPFYISVCEVTNAQYEQFDADHGLIDHRGFTHEPDEAVIFVSWEDANAFCTWLSQREGRPYRLPTEAEWEYACRAGTTTNYHTGDTLPAEYQKNQVETSGPYPVPLYVGQTPPNPWGLCDVHGNVEEWCHDWYGPYEAGGQTDPVGRVDGRFRVSRGGSHSTTVGYLRSANRMGTLPEDKHWLIGFRVVQGEMPTTEPLPEPPPELYQTGVDQNVPADINEGPDPNVPYFRGPVTYVKIPPDSYGPLFSAHNHDPGFTECPNGDLLAIWYTCIREQGRELGVAVSRLRYGRQEWEPASPFWDAPDRNDHCPAMWMDETGRLYHFAGLADAATWGALAVVMRTSTDNGVTWSRARLIIPSHAERHMCVESVFRTSDGAILLPCDANPGTATWLSYDNGLTWFDPGGTIAGIHAGVVQLNDGRLMAFGRGDNIDNKMPKSISSNMGQTWTYSASEFAPISGGQRLILRRLKEGPLLFVSFTGSAGMVINGQQVYGMFAALSYDEGQTWPVKKLVTAGGPPQDLDGGGNTGWFTMDDTHAEPKGYLAAVQTPDGVIHLISSALHYQFNLAWLRHKNLLVVDDFESYTDDAGANPIFDTWQDYKHDPCNGAVVYRETSIARDNQSMMLYYDNSWPSYCRAVRTYQTAQDLTESDFRALSLWFYGQSANNADDRMYVLLGDGQGRSATVTYGGDADDVRKEQWQEWHIRLQDFNDGGVNLADVNVLAIEITGTQYGALYFDDIRLYPSRCVAEYGPQGDVTSDCAVDHTDLKIMADAWLDSEKTLDGAPPDPLHLRLWYPFDESSGYIAYDSSGYWYDGILEGPEAGWDPDGGYHGGCRIFADDTAIAVPTAALGDIGGQITVAVWLKDAWRSGSDNWVFETGAGGFFMHAAVVTAAGLEALWRAGNDSNDVLTWDLDGHSPRDIEGWHHWAFVKDESQGQMQLYFDGQSAESKTGTADSLVNIRNAPFDIGAAIGHENDFIGKMDDFKIYDYALSQAEIVGAASGGGDLFVPLLYPGADLFKDGKVDFKDYTKLAASWLQEQFWPPN